MQIKLTRTALLTIASFELSGCIATDITNGPPAIAFETTAKAEDIRDCINAKDPGAFATIPYQGGWLLAYELDCRGKQMRALDVTVGARSSSRPGDWKNIPPESNGSNLVTMLCPLV